MNSLIYFFFNTIFLSVIMTTSFTDSSLFDLENLIDY